MHPGDLFVLTPPYFADPGLAIAACRAGARGTLDLAHLSPAQAQSALQRLEQFTTTSYGASVGPQSGSSLDQLLEPQRPRLGWVILAGGIHSQSAAWLERFRSAGIHAYIECVDASEMRWAIQHQATGLILKGHESGGRVGEETSFILIQRWFGELAPTLDSIPPVFVQGGIGLHTAAACAAAGVQGLVLDSQVLLAREATWQPATRQWLRNFDGSQTAVVGHLPSQRLRVAHWPRSPLSQALEVAADKITSDGASQPDRIEAWQLAATDILRGESPWQFRTLGQDAVCAASLADRFRTVGGIVQAFVDQVAESLSIARSLQPLDEGAPLSVSHGTRYPILQGPMTRVSDTAPFALSVAQAGALPFLALALLRKAETETLLQETKQKLGDLPWGAGILGFLPPEIRQEQTAAILATRPPFALIAGGRPDQARQFEEQGIPTYLHVPSPNLLRMFLKEGARRFILEGRECGGHVGPRTSFALWDAACEVILEHLGAKASGEELHIVFAGGIHDDLSGAMVSALAARLAQRKVKVGVLMGTAYLFTQEAVASGAIVERFQDEALRCDQTVLLESGPGHAIRCVSTPYCDAFAAEKQRLEQAGKSPEEIARTLEWMNVGRLRVASKGQDRVTPPGQTSSALVPVSGQEQYDRGMYMIGQLSALRHNVVSMADLHESVCRGAVQRLGTHGAPQVAHKVDEPPCDIAIIGMSSVYPGAINMQEYWSNILHKVYTVTEVPESHWDWSLYYDSNPMAKDKIISKWGGFLPDIPFDPFRYGITPAAMKVIEPLQLLLLDTVRHALRDAGYDQRPFARERTAAVCGIGGGGSPMATFYGFRACMPLVNSVPGMEVLSKEILETCDPLLPEWTEDSFPGFLMNVAVGRVSNRFNLGGPNFAVDAACASSLAAVQLCVRELQAGTSDVALAMGADTVQTPFAYMAFSKTFALSRAGRCRPFDAAADGIVLSEGIGVVVLKRLADAERDGDNILAVIRGVGSSSDGREKGLTAPNALGQTRALERAYRQAGISPSRVALVEAHGTGTVVGDRTEAQSLGTFLRDSKADPASCAVGSVKSMMGHSKCAAGIAGLIKTTLALHHKVLPPTLVEKPNPNAGFDGGPLYLNTQARPWIHGGEQPRCAGVSAFGFGGTNFHVVLEEYTGKFADTEPSALRDWDAELVVCRQPTRAGLLHVLQQVQQGLSRGGKPRLADLAATLWRGNSTNPEHPVAAVVATSLDDLRDKLLLLIGVLRGKEPEKSDPRGFYFAEQPRAQASQLGFLFPGQGSQYPNMLADLALAFPQVRASLDASEATLRGKVDKPLSRYIYPPSTFDDEAAQQQIVDLARTDIAQSALAATSLAVAHLLEQFGVHANALTGHSFGEYLALSAAGSLSDSELLHLAHRRGTLMAQAGGKHPGAMAAVVADAPTVTDKLAGLAGVTLANLNSPQQTVISASRTVLDQAVKKLSAAGLRAIPLPVSGAFHSPHVAAAAEQLADSLRQLNWSAPSVPVYSNVTGKPHAQQVATVVEQMAAHITSPVRFIEQIEAMYAAGIRTFVEVGPQGVLTGLVRQILGERPHVALATDSKSRSGVTQLAHTLAQLIVHGVDVNAGVWFLPRVETTFELADLEQQPITPPVSASAWIVNGVRAKPLNAPEPLLLGKRISPEDVISIKPKTVETTSKFSATNAPATPHVPTVAPVQPAPQTSLAPPPPIALTAPAVTKPIATPAAPAAPQHNLTSAETRTVESSTRNALSAVPSEAAVDEVTMVMCRYQDLMARFLDSQQQVLHDYFQTVSGAAPTSAPVASAPLTSLSHAAPTSQPAYQTVPVPSVATVSVPTVPAVVVPHAPLPVVADTAPPLDLSAIQATPALPVATNGAPQVPAVAPAPSSGLVKVSKDELANRLLELVSKRTGYPREMLVLDLDLEADLGVDSIKRVEILGTLAESLGGTESELGGKLEIEKLTGLRTLQGILDYLDQAIFQDNAPAATTPAAVPKLTHTPSALPAVNGANGHASHAATTTPLEVQRALVELIDAPLPSSNMLIPAGAVLITMDDYGVAKLVGQKLADVGQRVAFLIGQGNAVEELETDVFTADLTCADQVTQLADKLRQQLGPIGAVLHLAPLAKTVPGETASQRAYRDVHSLYLLARNLAGDLEQAAAQGGAVLMAAMSLGGRLGFESAHCNGHYQAGHGGISGFLKCVAQEWPEVLVRAVDVDLETPAEELADAFLAELCDPHGPIEIGCSAHGRITWQPVQAPLAVEASEAWPLEPGAPVLITGGARGITAQVAVALAKRGQPHLILVGRSPEPEATEPADVAIFTEPADIKRALIDRFKAAGQSTAPAAVEAEYRRLIAAREVRATLQQLTAAGSTWEYHALDVRDTEAFTRLIEDLNSRGPLQGLIHGAGVIEDRLLADKTPESFDRVWRTKVDSAFVLAERLDPSQLKFAIFFASLASRYGNRGQSDYAAANDVLSKLAIELDRRWPARVCAIAWGPWSGVGMVAELEPHLTRRGLKLIDPVEGPQFVLDEILAGSKGDSEVIVAGGAEKLVQPRGQAAALTQ
jgi:acyl transferase domain-containing protein/NAD(P)H-dependent flavin oxidoreductase YrpB (nitropropane dioxygenase family)/NAD(P)-dependent dehydrogenase (short-subunit alcohol dehydrogenase family)